jgi:hypothetical protein
MFVSPLWDASKYPSFGDLHLTFCLFNKDFSCSKVHLSFRTTCAMKKIFLLSVVLLVPFAQAQSTLQSPELAYPKDKVSLAVGGDFWALSFHWNPVDNATGYEFQISVFEDQFNKLYFQHIEKNYSEITIPFTHLGKTIKYIWRVRAIKDTELGAWSQVNEVSVSVVVANEADLVPQESSPIVLYPNPIQQQFNMMITLNRPQQVGISLWDLQGRQIRDWEDEFMGIGTTTKQYDLGDAPNGVYLARIQVGHEVHTLKIVKK